jgi:hypothetical protein
MNVDTDRIHIVPAEVVYPKRLRAEEPEGSTVLWTAPNWVLRVYSKHQRGMTNFALIFRNATIGTRQEFGGPIVHENYAMMIALPTVISRHPQAPVIRHEAQVGDLIVFADLLWQIREAKPLHDPYLVLVG